MRKTLFILAALMGVLHAAASEAQGTTGTSQQPMSPVTLIGALLTVAIATGAVWLAARRTTILKDNLLPQIAPMQQPYSLGRWQMAFWFTLIFFSYVVIFLVTGRYNAIAPQALWLMGISATSGVAAIAVDVVKESPADAVNRGLRALAFQTYTDVQAVRREISDRERELKANPPPANAQQLTLEIRDRNLALTAYGNAIRPYVSEGWYKDLTTDLNGAALHRVQVLVWTITLGVVFTIEVFSNLAMPQFDSSLLLLLGISNASYVGFKYPEPQQ